MNLTIEQLVDNQKVEFERANVHKKVSWERERQFVLQALKSSDYLAQSALSDPIRTGSSIVRLAAIGISLDPSLKHAYLVPKAMKQNGKPVRFANLDISYIGLLHLAVDSGSIEWGQSRMVYDADTFELNGLSEQPTHKHNPFEKNRGNPVGAYCTVKTTSGDYLTETMPISEIYDIRARSESYKKGYGPWKTDEGEMIKKTVIKRASKLWPKIQRLSEAVDYLNTENGEGFESEPEMPHVSEAEKEANRAEQQRLENERFEQITNEACEKMDLSKSLEELKEVYIPAYKATQGSDFQKNIMICCNENKRRLKVEQNV